MVGAIRKHRWAGWVGWWVVVGGVGWGVGGWKLNFYHNFQEYLPARDTLYPYYLKLRQLFGPDDEWLLVGFIHEPSIWERHFLKQVDSIGVLLAGHPSIKRLFIPTRIVVPGFVGPLIDPNSSNFFYDSIRLNTSTIAPLITNSQNTTLLLLCETNPTASFKEKRSLVELLRSIKQQHQLFVAGKVWAEVYLIDGLAREFMGFSIAGLLLVGIVLWLTLGRWQIVLISVMVCMLSLWVNGGIMSAAGVRVREGAIVMPVVWFVSIISDIIHTQLHSQYKVPPHIKKSAFFTSATTAIGFASLLTANVPVLQWMGLWTAIGILISHIVMRSVVFNAVSSGIAPVGRPLLFAGVEYLFASLQKPPTYILLVILTILLSGGVFLLSTTSHFVEEFSPSHPVVRDYTLLTTKMKFNSQIQFLYSSSISPHEHKHLLELMRQIYGDNPIILHPMIKSPFPLPFRLTADEWHRIVVLTHDQGSTETLKKATQLTTLAATHGITVIPTGWTFLHYRNVIHLLNNLLSTLVLVVVLIAVAVGIALLNARLLITFLLPNILALIATGALMGWLDISVRATTVVFFAIVFGFVVDNTTYILFSWVFSQREERHHSVVRSVAAAILTAVAMAIVFFMLMLSEFRAVREFGALCSLAILVGTIFDIWLIPLLLVGKKNHTNKQQIYSS